MIDVCDMFKGLISLLAAVDALSHVDGWDDLNKQVCTIGIPYKYFSGSM